MTVTDPLIDPSPAPVVAPIAAAAPADPDADWETVRARVMARLAAEVGGAWSDHNAADPGVTLAESAAFGLADLHYRIAERSFDAWPLEVRAWEADAERHWHATLPALSPSPLPSPPPAASLTGLADALAAAATNARVLEPLVRGCESREAALALLASAPWSAALAPEHRPAVVSLMRSRWVRQVAQEQAHVVVAALAAEAAAPDAGTVEERDARATGRLALTLPLWPDELTAVVRRERRRLAVAVLVAHLAQIRALTPQTPPVQVAALEADLAARDLDADEVALALSAAEQPPGLLPEHLEDAGGRSRIWPPHPLQALTCEPVTALDYARRAREHPQVGRAWAVPGRLEGVAWNGLPTGAMASIPVDPGAPALTLVVERTGGTSSRAVFLRSVLRVAVGPEVDTAFPDWRTDSDELAPRRLVCDEVGAALLDTVRVLVQATLVTQGGADRDQVIDGVRDRIETFFAAGRPESRGPDPTGAVDGPWPRIEQPAGGWIPGDPIRFTEVVEQIVVDPQVHGVEKLAMKVAGDPVFVPATEGSLVIPPDAVPVLDPARCLHVRFVLSTTSGGCADG